LAILPYVCLRVRIPSLEYETGWAGYALHNPGATVLNWPGIFMILLTRLFVNQDFANWSDAGGRFHWIGRWNGLSSLNNHSTLCLAWLCLLLTVALWFAVPARRRVVAWMLAMLMGAAAAFSGIFVSFIGIKGLSEAINYTVDVAAGRYLLPMLLAWFATIMTMFFAESPSATTADRSLPVLKHGYWLAVGAVLILVLGVFVLPKNESPLPENPLQSATAANSLNGSEDNSLENPELQKRMAQAIQLDKAGKFAEALQAYREAARLYPNEPMALNNLAWSLAANPRPELRNGKEAVQLASQAVELTGQQQAIPLATLAAAYAEDGQFDKAVEMAKKACAIALLNDHPEIAAVNEQLLKLYSAGKAVGLTNGP
jgi:tetratricopeptide (TPR) repeat protein